MPLILVGAGPIAAFLKIYALVPIALTLRWRALLVTGIALIVTAPLLPWGSYLAQFGDLSNALAEQSDGGLSATAIPWLIPIAVIALVAAGRERAAWLSVPALWPATQWYYSTLAVPALTPIAAAVIAIPVPERQSSPRPSSRSSAGTRAWTVSSPTGARRGRAPRACPDPRSPATLGILGRP